MLKLASGHAEGHTHEIVSLPKVKVRRCLDGLQQYLLNFQTKVSNGKRKLAQHEVFDMAKIEEKIEKPRKQHNFEAVCFLEKMLKVISRFR